MMAKMQGAPRQDQRRLAGSTRSRRRCRRAGALALFDDGDGDGGDAMRAGDGAVQLERAQAAPDLIPQRVIELHANPRSWPSRGFRRSRPTAEN
jgi:hypothetical protein